MIKAKSQYSSDSEDSMPLHRMSTMKDQSSDSEDNMPIGSLKSNNPNSYSNLCKQGLERCEFCDQLFNTRLANIKHNATHIIIPLLKLTLHQCDHCLFHFTSLENLRTHATSKNHKTSQFPDKPSHLKSGIAGYEKIMQSIVETQVIVKCHDTLSEVINPIKHNNIPIPAPSPKELNSSIKEEVIVYEISSDSEDEHLMRVYNAEIKSNQVRENGKQERNNSYLKREEGNQKRENGYLEKENIKQERQNGDLERENINRERENSIQKRENGDVDDRSIPFNSSYLEMSSPSPSPLEPLSCRIMFEEDIEDDDLFEAEEILPDKPYFPKKNSYIIGSNACTDTNRNYDIAKSIQNAIVDAFNNSYNNTIPNVNSFIFGSQTCKTPNDLVSQTFKAPNKLLSQTCKAPNKLVNQTLKTMNGVTKKTEEYTESVHFDELVAPQICDCRYCGRCFSNRLELIKHESIHMRARPPRLIVCCVCERYLSGNHWTLRKHMQKYHPDNDIKRKIQRCSICRLPYYNYVRHARYYHQGSSNTCYGSFDRHNPRTLECIDYSASYKPVQSDLTADTRVIKLCEICLVFVKNRQNVHYQVICEHSEVGTRQQCDRCHNICFEVSLVRRKVKQRENPGVYRRKPLSNEERLKKMQSRLKMVNKLNKC